MITSLLSLRSVSERSHPLSLSELSVPPIFSLQIIPLPEPIPVNSIHLLVAGDGTDGETTEKIGLRFGDGSFGALELDL